MEPVFTLNGSVLAATLFGNGRDRHHCVAGDIDNDAFVDIYCTNGADRGTGRGPMKFGVK